MNAITHALPGNHVVRVDGVKWRQWASETHFVAVIQTGIGPANAQDACEAVVGKRPWTAFIASGFAGALVPSQIGDLVIPEQVVCQDSKITGRSAAISCSSLHRQQAWNTTQSVKNTVLSGRLVTAEEIVWLARDKQAIGAAFAASSLDMESAAIGATAARQGIPFFVVRSVSDRVEEDLPLDLNLFCRPGMFWQGVWTVATTPGLWPKFNRLRRQKNVASASLSQFYENYFSRAENKA